MKSNKREIIDTYWDNNIKETLQTIHNVAQQKGMVKSFFRCYYYLPFIKPEDFEKKVVNKYFKIGRAHV